MKLDLIIIDFTVDYNIKSNIKLLNLNNKYIENGYKKSIRIIFEHDGNTNKFHKRYYCKLNICILFLL